MAITLKSYFKHWLDEIQNSSNHTYVERVKRSARSIYGIDLEEKKKADRRRISLHPNTMVVTEKSLSLKTRGFNLLHVPTMITSVVKQGCLRLVDKRVRSLDKKAKAAAALNNPPPVLQPGEEKLEMEQEYIPTPMRWQVAKGVINVTAGAADAISFVVCTKMLGMSVDTGIDKCCGNEERIKIVPLPSLQHKRSSSRLSIAPVPVMVAGAGTSAVMSALHVQTDAFTSLATSIERASPSGAASSHLPKSPSKSPSCARIDEENEVDMDEEKYSQERYEDEEKYEKEGKSTDPQFNQEIQMGELPRLSRSGSRSQLVFLGSPIPSTTPVSEVNIPPGIDITPRTTVRIVTTGHPLEAPLPPILPGAVTVSIDPVHEKPLPLGSPRAI